MAVIDDKTIIGLYFARNEQAIVETKMKYGSYVHAIALNILQSSDDAEECANDTYLDTWNSIPPHKPSHLATYLGKIARRRAVDTLRKINRLKRGGGEISLVFEELDECISHESTQESELIAKELKYAIRLFLQNLPEAEQKVFLCRYYYVESVSVIARRFSYSQSKVKSMLKRTRDKLKIYLEKESLL